AALNKILASAQDLGTPGRDDDTGYGLLDIAAALDVERPTVTSPPPPPPPPASPATSPIPTISPSPSPLLLPPPGEPPVFEPQASGTVDESPSPSALGVVDDHTFDRSDLAPAIAGILIALVSAMHAVRRTLL
ncbi:MAG: hypothetical protein ABIS18_04295, partial [Actinomycetota bacterium]